MDSKLFSPEVVALLKETNQRVCNRYCGACRKTRRFDCGSIPQYICDRSAPSIFDHVQSFVVWLTCKHCSIYYWSFVYQSETTINVAVFANSQETFTNTEAPPLVGYFLDEASKSKGVGATVAAIAMYRAALEHLLTHLGHVEGMLDEKIRSFEFDSRWQSKITVDLMDLLKRLGNSSIHPKRGKLPRLFSAQELDAFDAAFAYLAFVLFDSQKQVENLKSRLQPVIEEWKSNA